MSQPRESRLALRCGVAAVVDAVQHSEVHGSVQCTRSSAVCGHGCMTGHGSSSSVGHTPQASSATGGNRKGVAMVQVGGKLYCREGGKNQKGGGELELTRGCKRSRIDCCTINAVGLCGVHQRSCDFVNKGDQRVCETTCLDIVGGLFKMGMQRRRSLTWRVMQGKGRQDLRACLWLAQIKVPEKACRTMHRADEDGRRTAASLTTSSFAQRTGICFCPC